MLASSEVMDSLKGIGLNLYERKLWIALLARGTSTAGELSEIANVPRSRSYDILQSLADKGFVVVQTGKPIKYVAVSPDNALDRIKEKLVEDIVAARNKVERLKESPVMKELNELYEKGMKLVSPEELTGSIKGKYSVSQQINSMLKGADNNINIVLNREGLKDFYSEHFDTLKEANKRGVNIKIATDASNKEIDMKSLSDIADVRNLSKKEIHISGKFLIVDGKETLLPLTDSSVHSTQDLAIWSKSSHVADGILNPLFNLAWNKSKPFEK